jgi:hypothetical protein
VQRLWCVSMGKKDKVKTAEPVVAVPAGGADEGALRDETLALIRELGITQAAAALDSDGDYAPTPTPAIKSTKKGDKVVNVAQAAVTVTTAKKDTSKPKPAVAAAGAVKAKVAPATAAGTSAGANGSAAKPQANGKPAATTKAAAKPKQTAAVTNGSTSASKPAAARQQPAKAAAPLAPAVPLTMRHPGCELSDEGGGWFDMVPATLTPPSGSLNGKQKKKMKKQEAAAAAAVVAAVAAGGSVTAPAVAAQGTGALYQPAPAEVIRRHREAAAVLLAKEVEAWEKQREKRQSGDDRYLSQVRAAVLPYMYFETQLLTYMGFCLIERDTVLVLAV